ncbi:MAG TPA: response regulator [Terriglobales bacterium]|nr:response regulator [Terriglobales bacterium]
MNSGEAFDVLLVEDNAGDVRLVREALREVPEPIRLHVVNDGLQALAFLQRRSPYEEHTAPHLILLDLNLPGLGGQQTLRAIKADEHLRSIPVIVMTSSASPGDIRHAYQGYANCYVTKAQDYEACVQLLHSLMHFWLHLARIPQ